MVETSGRWPNLFKSGRDDRNNAQQMQAGLGAFNIATDLGNPELSPWLMRATAIAGYTAAIDQAADGEVSKAAATAASTTNGLIAHGETVRKLWNSTTTGAKLYYTGSLAVKGAVSSTVVGAVAFVAVEQFGVGMWEARGADPYHQPRNELDAVLSSLKQHTDLQSEIFDYIPDDHMREIFSHVAMQMDRQNNAESYEEQSRLGGEMLVTVSAYMRRSGENYETLNAVFEQAARWAELDARAPEVDINDIIEIEQAVNFLANLDRNGEGDIWLDKCEHALFEDGFSKAASFLGTEVYKEHYAHIFDSLTPEELEALTTISKIVFPDSSCESLADLKVTPPNPSGDNTKALGRT